MAYKLLSDCPVCSDKLKAVKLTCSTCGTSIESEFEFSRFEHLSDEHLRFAEIFIKCGGSIKEVEKELGISYPTVKSRLNDVIRALGYEVNEERIMDVKNIIDKLESGEITPDDAVKKIKSKS
jgi:hypothetical protein